MNRLLGIVGIISLATLMGGCTLFAKEALLAENEKEGGLNHTVKEVVMNGISVIIASETPSNYSHSYSDSVTEDEDGKVVRKIVMDINKRN